jgi:imidazoleglycerol-phosphate dehydratase
MKKFSRKTAETDVTAIFDADKTDISTGIGFFDHMLKTLAIHSGFNLIIRAEGDDTHHIIEDVAICLGRAISEVKKEGIRRYGHAIVPMDDSVAICGLDFSGRGAFIFDGELTGYSEMTAENFLHFFDTLCRNSGLNVYLRVKGTNSHHMIEASFKAFAISLSEALLPEKNKKSYRSAKGVLD